MPSARKAMAVALAKENALEKVKAAYNAVVAPSLEGRIAKEAFKAALWREFGI